jgi:hypothetical protein
MMFFNPFLSFHSGTKRAEVARLMAAIRRASSWVSNLPLSADPADARNDKGEALVC